MFREGDWIKTVRWGTTVFGTIDKVREHDLLIEKVFEIDKRDGKKVYYTYKNKISVMKENAEPAELELTEEDYKTLMHEAVRTKDKRWFYQLHARKNGKKMCVECGVKEVYFGSKYLCESCYQELLNTKIKEEL